MSTGNHPIEQLTLDTRLRHAFCTGIVVLGLFTVPASNAQQVPPVGIVLAEPAGAIRCSS